MKNKLIVGFMFALMLIIGFLAGSLWVSLRYLSDFKISMGSQSAMREIPSGDDSFFGYWPFGFSMMEAPPGRLPEGGGYLLSKFTVNGSPASGVRCSLVLNGKYESEPLETDAEGILTVRLPKGQWAVTSIQCDLWRNKPAGDFMLVAPGIRTLDEGAQAGWGAPLDAAGKTITVGESRPAVPQLLFEIRPRIGMLWPDTYSPKQDASIRQTKIRWKLYPDAEDYMVTVSKVNRKERSTYYVPILRRKVHERGELALSDLTYARDAKADEEYGVAVEAYGRRGEFLSESQSLGTATFKFNDGNVLVASPAGIGGPVDPQAYVSRRKDEKILAAVETLIEERIFDQADMMLQKVQTSGLM